MKYKAVIFDFDLTLADTWKGIQICFKHTLKKFGYPIPNDVIIYNTIGKTLVDSFDVLTGKMNNPDREAMRVEYVKKADEEMVKNTRFYDGAAEALERLRAKGVKIGICSTKYRYRIVQSFEEKVGSLPVDLIIGGEDVSEPKPDPSGLIKCIEGLDVEKDEVLYVGDNTIDAQTAWNARVDFAAVLTGSTSADVFEEYPYVRIAEGVADLILSIE